MINDQDGDWQEKCYRCSHVYIPKYDADEVRCRCRTGCHFKEVKLSKTCGNCRHCERIKALCRCDIDKRYLGNVDVMPDGCNQWESNEI